MITESTPPAQRPTRERLMEAGLALFVCRGFDGVTVGEIEAAAGLRPRRGGLYRHFKSKEALLAEAVASHLARVRQVELDLQAADLPPGDVARIFGRWLLADMDAQRAITHILEREGERFTALREDFRTSADLGFKASAELLRRWFAASLPDIDAEAAAALLVGGLVNARRGQWTLGAPPLGLDDDRLVEALARLVEVLAGHRSPASDLAAS